MNVKISFLVYWILVFVEYGENLVLGILWELNIEENKRIYLKKFEGLM